MERPGRGIIAGFVCCFAHNYFLQRHSRTMILAQSKIILYSEHIYNVHKKDFPQTHDFAPSKNAMLCTI